MPSQAKKPPTSDPSVIYADHPLFPVDEGETPPRIAFIHVTRKELGVMKYGPMLRADELLSLDTIFERWGGGNYELVGRAPSVRDPSMAGNITRRRWYPIPGRSKPLSQDPTSDEMRQAEGVRAAEPSPAAPASSSTNVLEAAGGNGLLVALLQMQAQQSQQFMALMMQLLTSSKSESAEAAKLQVQQQQQFVQMMMTLSAQQQQSLVTMMTASMQGRGGGPEEMAKYAKLLRDLGLAGGTKPEGEQPEGFGKIVEDAADFVQGLVQLKGSVPTNGAPASPPAPGSAAAVAAELGAK